MKLLFVPFSPISIVLQDGSIKSKILFIVYTMRIE